MDVFRLINLLSCVILVNLCSETWGSGWKDLEKNLNIVHYLSDETTCTTKLSECSVRGDYELPLQGPKGDVGYMGPPGPCNCAPKGNDENKRPDTPKEALTNTCRNAVNGSKPQWMGRNERESFKIECTEANGMSCIVRDTIAAPETVEVTKAIINENKLIHWNKLANNSLLKMLNAQPSQITWLHGIINTASQTIRISGLNITPQNVDTVGSIVNLITWNDVKIGAIFTKLTPFYYKVELPKSCEEKNTPEACDYIDLKIKTNMVVRLPITDIIFNFGSIERDLSISVQIVEFCFD